jgi:hypothetical protein
MAVMERSHGWHQRGRGLSRAKALDGMQGSCGRSWGFATSGLDLWGQGGSRLAGLRRDADLIKADGRPPSGRSTSANRGGSSRARQTASVAVPRARFMIKADDQRFANAIAHFT